MKNLVTRSVTGIVFVAVMIGAILFSQYSFMVIMSVVLVGALYEYYNIAGEKLNYAKGTGVKWVVIVLGLIVYLKSFLLNNAPATGLPNMDNLAIAFLQGLTRLRDANVSMNFGIPVFVFLLFAYELFAKSEKPFENIGWNITAIMWIVVPVVLTNRLYFQYGAYFLVALFLLIWIYDSASYATGSLLGKHPLMPRISPKKTVEGMIGGIVFTLGFAFFFNKCTYLGQFSRVEWLIFALVVIVASTFGDLVESMLKRSLAIKDSGSIMPGHGGFLDRFDAYFFTVPFMLSVLWLLAQIRNMLLIMDYLNH